jgi:hypothetical protein
MRGVEEDGRREEKGGEGKKVMDIGEVKRGNK